MRDGWRDRRPLPDMESFRPPQSLGPSGRTTWAAPRPTLAIPLRSPSASHQIFRRVLPSLLSSFLLLALKQRIRLFTARDRFFSPRTLSTHRRPAVSPSASIQSSPLRLYPPHRPFVTFLTSYFYPASFHVLDILAATTAFKFHQFRPDRLWMSTTSAEHGSSTASWVEAFILH